MRLTSPTAGFALAVLLAWTTPSAASTIVYHCPGVVFEDRNGDGNRSDGEPGIPGVAVYADGSNRSSRTDDDGRFLLTLVDDASAFVVKPAGYRIGVDPNGLPATHWSTSVEFPETRPSGGPPFTIRGCDREIPLQRDPRPAGELDVLLFADPQPKNARHVGFYGRAIIDGVRAVHGDDAPPADLGLTLGDIVDDDVSLFPAMNRLTTSLGVPWLHAPGNHDVDVAEPHDVGSLRSFHATFGPDTYAWEEHEASFIVLDDVIWHPGDGQPYIGGLRADQFAFLDAYLRELPATRPLVIAAHMPFFDDKPGVTTFRPADRERLFALLQRFEHVLLLTGHGHVQRQHRHDATTGWHGASPLHEYNVGAACGSYWGGVDDAAGVPTSWMADGTPKGWAELTLREHGRYDLRWRVAEAGIDPDTAIALHAPAALRRGSYPGTGVWANVFMADADARVEVRIDEGDWRPMKRVDRPDPRVVAENVADDAADAPRAFDRLPEAAPSTHLWRFALPTDLAPGAHRVQVRAADPWRGEVFAETSYRLVEWTASAAGAREPEAPAADAGGPPAN